MKRTLYNKWIKALESGKYKQGQGFLNQKNKKFCCLGVLCEVAGIPKHKLNGEYGYGKERADELLPKSFAKRIGMDYGGESLYGDPLIDDDTLVYLNDNGYSFKKIAKVLRERPLDFIKSLTK